ncbi:MAG: DUF2461 domain-containing protein [Armatimonadetes bacterium]|nr:DUF2461 domain-containing protein [Armatimonadota bacterium]
MAWFTADAIDFLGELALNNNRDWFTKNKKRYEQSLKNPMLAFASEMIERMRAVDPEISMLPSQAVFRIHRDTRFSKDKAPYKTNAGMAISRGGKTEPGSPGVYVHLDPGCMAIASGCYFLEPPQILAVRKHIASNMVEFERLLADPTFKKHFGKVVGEKNKILPPEFREAAARQPLLYNKQFYYWAELAPETVLRDDLPEFVMEHVRAAGPMNAFLKAALT